MKRTGIITGLAGILVALMMISPVVSATIWPDNNTMHGPDITWSGRTWWVCDWSYYRSDYVSVDGNGWLHLKQSGAGDSGIITYDKCGYGTYTWVMKGVTNLDRYSVIGMYPYLSDSNAPSMHEVDIEQAKWGGSTYNFDFWVQPNSAHVNQVFTLPYTANDTTFVIDWEHTYDQFYILDTGTGRVLRSWNATATRDATGVYGITNVWHYLNPTTADTNVVFKSFSYQANHIYQPPGVSYPPVISSSPLLTIAGGANYSYNPVASGGTTWSCSGRPSGMNINTSTGAIRWTGAVVGDYPLVLTATNSYGSITQSFTLHVGTSVQAPHIASLPNTNATTGYSYSYQPVGTNDPTWSCTGMPDGMTVDGITGTLSWLNPVEGFYPLTLMATNSADSDSQTFTLNVTGASAGQDDDGNAIAAHGTIDSPYTNAILNGGHGGGTKAALISKWVYVGAAVASVTVIGAIIVMSNGGGKKGRRTKRRR